jgi:hypothetical protein
VPEDLEEQGVEIADVDASIGKVLEQMERSNEEIEEAETDAIDDGYDPEAAETPTPEGVA